MSPIDTDITAAEDNTSEVDSEQCRVAQERSKFTEARSTTLRQMSQACLDDIVLTAQELGGIDLTMANLTGLSLRKRHLEQAWFNFSDLTKADAAGANLSGARLNHVRLNSVNMSGAVLSNALMASASGLRANFANAALSCVYADGVEMVNASFDGALLSRIAMTRASLSFCSFVQAKLRHANLRGSDLAYADFSHADLSSASFSGACLRDAALCHADLTRAKFARTSLECTRFDGAYVRTNDDGDERNSLLVGKTPIMQIGPIGTRDDFLVGFNTEHGLYVHVACFFGTAEALAERLDLKVANGTYPKSAANVYKQALRMLRYMCKSSRKPRGRSATTPAPAPSKE